MNAVLAWLDLGPDEALFLEAAEDFDRVGPDGSDATQVKFQRRPVKRLTLNSAEAISALENAWRVIRDNPDRLVTYRHITRAIPGRERGDPLGLGAPAVQIWQRVQASPLSECSSATIALRAFVARHPRLSRELRAWAANVSIEAFHEQFVRRIVWLSDAPEAAILIAQIRERLITLGRTVTLGTQDSCDALDPIYRSALSAAAGEGVRRLTRADLLTIFDDATRMSMSKGDVNRLVHNLARQGSEAHSGVTADAWLDHLWAWLRRELDAPQLFAPTQECGWAPVAIEDFHTAAPLGCGAAAVTARLHSGSTIALVGGSGSGKTTLLKQIAANACEARSAIPVVIDCTVFGGDLQAAVMAQARALQCPAPALSELQSGPAPLLLLCDDFHRCRDKRALLAQIRALQSRGSGAAVVLFTHDLPELRLLGSTSLPAMRVSELEDAGVRAVFERHLDNGAADQLFEEIVASGDLDAFRSPLLASLLAQARQRSATSLLVDRSYRKGQLYREVVSEGALGIWASQRRPDLHSPLAAPARLALGALARRLLERGDDDLPQAELAAVIGRTTMGTPLGELLECAESCGLIWRREARLGFMHVGIRDYFAAEDLVSGPPHRLMIAWFSPRWHNSLKVFASLASYDHRSIFWLRLCGRLSSRLLGVLRMSGEAYQTRLFYFMLEFAWESDLKEDWLQLELFHFFRDGTVYLSHAVAVPYRPLRSLTEDRYAFATRLLGRLQHPEIHAWLRDPKSRLSLRDRIHGISQDRSPEGLRALLASLADESDSIAHALIAELAFDYLPHVVEPVIRDFLSDPDAPRARLLRAINHNLAGGAYSDHEYGKHRHSRGERVRTIISQAPYWREVLLDLLLRDEETVADAAEALLRQFDTDSWALRRDLQSSLAEVLQNGEPAERRRAASSLRYAGRSPEIVGLLRRCLGRDSDFRTCASAADGLLFWDRGRAHAHMFKLLSRWGGGLDRARLNACESTLSLFLGALSEKPFGRVGTSYVRMFATYAAGAEQAFDRKVAIIGLKQFPGRCVANLFRDLLITEGDPGVRWDLAQAWAWHSGGVPDEVGGTLIHDPQPRVRKLIGSWLLQQRGQLHANTVDLLHAAAETDPDEDVRRLLTMGVKAFVSRQSIEQ